jgi:hypothetical protein
MYELKQKVIEEFKMKEEEFLLSMGTSADFEEAVRFILFGDIFGLDNRRRQCNKSRDNYLWS